MLQTTSQANPAIYRDILPVRLDVRLAMNHSFTDKSLSHQQTCRAHKSSLAALLFDKSDNDPLRACWLRERAAESGYKERSHEEGVMHLS